MSDVLTAQQPLQGRRHAHPHRIGVVADARRADPRACSRVSRPRNGISGIRRAATTRASARSSRSANSSTRSTASIRPTSSSRSTPTSSAAARARLRYAQRLRRAAAARAGRPHEPPLRDRVDADADRRARRSSAAAASRVDASARVGAALGARASGGRACWRVWRVGGRRGRRTRRERRSSSRPSRKICRRIAGASLVIAGDGQPAAVHALAHAMNQALGNVGETVVYTQTAEAEPVDQLESMRDLVADMNGGKVDLLLILGGNPVYTAPADLEFRRRDRQGAAARAPRASTRTRPPRSATGRFRRRTSSKRGATRARSTAPSRSSSR